MGNYSSFDISNIKNKNYYSLLIELVECIKSMKLKVGDHLPQESILAEKLNTNRSTLREMLRVLEVMGVITSKRGAGNIYLGNLEIGFMNLFILSEALQTETTSGFFHIRSLIEVCAIEEFVEKAGDADVFKLELILQDELDAAVEKGSFEYLDAHIKFHDQLMKYYPNEVAKQFIRSNLRMMERDYERRVAVSAISEKQKAEIYEELESASHNKIVEAVKHRDKEAARDLMSKHSLIAAKRIKK